MRDRFKFAFIALTAVVVTLALGSAALASKNATPPSYEAHFSFSSPTPNARVAAATLATLVVIVATPSHMPTPSPTASPTPTSTPTATPKPTRTPRPTAKPVPTATPRTQWTTYAVKAGDTFVRIARSFDLKVTTLTAANPSILDTGVLTVGQEIQIPPAGWVPGPGATVR